MEAVSGLPVRESVAREALMLAESGSEDAGLVGRVLEDWPGLSSLELEETKRV